MISISDLLTLMKNDFVMYLVILDHIVIEVPSLLLLFSIKVTFWDSFARNTEIPFHLPHSFLTTQHTFMMLITDQFQSKTSHSQ